MITVATEVRQSTIKSAGKGLFTKEFIPKGTVVWRFNRTTDEILTDKELEALDPKEQERIKFHAYRSHLTGLWIICNDGGQYVNHSDTPNLVIVTDLSRSPETLDVADRDIEAGEELFDNYSEYDTDASTKLPGLKLDHTLKP